MNRFSIVLIVVAMLIPGISIAGDLNFTQFISSNATTGGVPLTGQEKVDMLNSFCEYTGYHSGSGLTKAEWLNQKLDDYILGKINSRRRAIAHQELDDNPTAGTTWTKLVWD